MLIAEWAGELGLDKEKAVDGEAFVDGDALLRIEPPCPLVCPGLMDRL